MPLIHIFPSRTVALSIGSFSIHWYGLLYVASFIIGYHLVLRLAKYKHIQFSKDEWSNIATRVILGVLIGGRVGYIVFYDPQFYLAYPLQVFAVWNGGMSSHGGFIGVLISLYTSPLVTRASLAKVLDCLIVPVAIGLCLGRIGNFINQELYGSITNVPWAIAIPGVDGLRHPTQLYAALKDVSLAITAYILLRNTKVARLDGFVTGVFLIEYSILRILIEFVRVPSHTLWSIGAYTVTRGQALSGLIFIAGVVFIWISLCIKMDKRLPMKTA